MLASRALVIAVPIVVGLSLPGDALFAQSACPSGDASPARIVSFDGQVALQRADGRSIPVERDLALCPGDRLVTGDASAIDIRFDAKNSVTNILSSSTVVIAEAPEADVTLSGGLMRFISSVRGIFVIRTPQTDAGIDGTEAMLAVDGPLRDTLVLVREGVVTVSDRRGDNRFALAAGEASYASAQTALVRATPENVPQKFRGYLLNPEGAADWAIYYPPILLGNGDATLERATALLDVGRPDDAEALLLAYRGPNPAEALALRAVTALLRNRAELGAELAAESVATDPSSGAAQIASSYAMQSRGDIEGALGAARRATMADPRDAYAWARLAELELTAGNRSAGREAAETSLGLAQSSLGQAVLGFALLAEDDISGARVAFELAIDLDSGAPLPRLGAGLARIAEGDLAGGRADLETAASLDPQRAQLRGWLGRAYQEEMLGEKATAQFRLAREMDPDDPVLWLFSAQERFVANLPAAALRDLQEAARRSNGRMTLRSQEGLGEDQATRATAEGRIYDVLGFEVQAAQAGAEAVTADPTNPGAHRFLADIYRARPGFEIAQSSELLTAQLLTGPTKSPVQPRLSEPDLALLNTPGAARVSFHEFSPVFDGDGIQAIASAALGNNQVFEDELSLSIKHGNVSLGIGQFHSQTNGFRENDDVRHDVFSLEAKARVLPWLTLTAEGRLRASEEGDRFLRSFDDQITLRTRTETERGQFMFGGHAEVSALNDLLFLVSFAQEDRVEEAAFVDAFFGPIVTTADERTQSFVAEVQDTHRFNIAGMRGNVIVGGVYAQSNLDGSFLELPDSDFREDTDQIVGYLYTNLLPLDGVDLTLGVNITSTRRTNIEPNLFGGFFPVERNETQVSPKVGLRLAPLDWLVLRGAYARTLKRDLVQDRTLEPTTLAGFNQFFDDPAQTDAMMLGGGIDVRVLDNVWVGGEYVFRNLDIPDLQSDPFTLANTVQVTRAGQERTVRGYVNATLGDNWAASAGLEYSRNDTELLDRPDVVDTLLVPFSLGYFDESGFFATGELVLFDQESRGNVQDAAGLLNIDTDEQGAIVNAVVGFRMPDSQGVASLEFNNLLDHDIALQNPLNNSARPSTRPLAESFSVIGRFTLGF